MSNGLTFELCNIFFDENFTVVVLGSVGVDVGSTSVTLARHYASIVYSQVLILCQPTSYIHHDAVILGTKQTQNVRSI